MVLDSRAGSPERQAFDPSSADPRHPRAAPAVELRAIGKRYGSTRALDGVSLTVEPGELLFLLGPSGAGKSTLLRIVGGYERPDAGAVYFSGRRVDDLPAHRRDIGTVFQSYALFPHMTVAENVGFGLKMRGVKEPERSERVGWALSLVRLDGLQRRFPRQLSGGQQQRVAVARAIAYRPALLLLDEPLASLDRQLREEMRIELRQLQRQLGISTIFVTHDQEESLTMADRVVVLRAGQVQQVASPRELYNRPANPFVASFIGEMNVLRGVVVGADGARAEIRVGGLQVPVRAERRLSLGTPVTVCVRAERIRLIEDAPRSAGLGEAAGSGAPADDHSAVRGLVRYSSYLGGSTLYLVEASDGTVFKVADPNPEGTVRFAPGDAVITSWPIEATVVFVDGS